jgi:hypothetical protein
MSRVEEENSTSEVASAREGTGDRSTGPVNENGDMIGAMNASVDRDPIEVELAWE